MVKKYKQKMGNLMTIVDISSGLWYTVAILAEVSTSQRESKMKEKKDALQRLDGDQSKS